MACKSCGGRRPTVALNSSANQAPPAQLGDDVLIVTYTGAKAGTTMWRGPSGTVYRFAAGDGPKYVAAADAGIFTGRADFTIQLRPPAAEVSASPTLVAEGAP